MSFWTLDNLQRVTAGTWLTQPTQLDAVVAGISTDTRTLRAGQAYLALRGEHHDGHDYLAAAERAGASLLIVAEAPEHNPGPPVSVVGDTLAALQAMARAYRDTLRQSNTTVIAVTGSNGKTTTRHLIHTLLSSRLAGTQSPHSYNNHIGVPLTLLAADPGHEFVVVEVGSNHPGEIAALAGIARPDIAVITNAGRAHTATLGSPAEIAVEKASLLGHVLPGGAAVVFGDNPNLAAHLDRVPDTVTKLRFGQAAHCDWRVIGVDTDDRGIGLTYTTGPDHGVEHRVHLPLVGEHNALNALAAAAVARQLGMSHDQIAGALAAATPVDMRLNVTTIGPPEKRVVVINDCYNANPDSTAAALKTLAAYPLTTPGGRRVAILGDMLELGDRAEALHRETGELVASLWRGQGRNADEGIDAAVMIGPVSGHTASAAAAGVPGGRDNAVCYIPDWDDQTPSRVAGLIQPGDVVLLKASRAMRLERVLAVLGA